MIEVYGVEVDELPENWTPLEVVVLVKCLNEDGDDAVANRISAGLSAWEALAMLGVEAARTQATILAGFEDEE